MNIETVLGMLCLCKQPQSRWTRRTTGARTRRVAEAGQRGQGTIVIHDRKRQR